MSSDSATALTCRGLWKVFGDKAEARLAQALQTGDRRAQRETLVAAGNIVGCADIDLDIRRGEFFVLMGLSGSGKSTLLRCLSRLTEPTEGALELDGRDFRRASARELREIRRDKMGMVFQHFGLFPHMSVLENVAFPLRVQGVSGTEREARAREMVELVGLAGREQAWPDELSGGQKQRVGIARSLAVDPDLWFLDEPFSALDPLIRWQMQSELQRLQSRFNKTIVFVTHDFMEAVRLADRIAIMKDGMIMQIGTPEDIVLNPADDYVAEFVKEVPRTRIIRVAQLVEPLTGEPPTDSVPLDLSLEQALALRAREAGSVAVHDSTGQTVGMISAARLAEALAGARN